MAIGDIQEGDTVQFEGVIKDEDDAVIDLDALSLTSQKLMIRDHLGAVTEFTTTFLTDGSDGIVKYRVATTFLKAGKRWTRQFYIKTATEEYSSGVVHFDVKEKLA